MNIRPLILLLVLCLDLSVIVLKAQTPLNSGSSSGSDYDQTISGGNAQLKAGDFQAAHEAAMKALGLDGNRFEAYALEALALFKQGKTDQARGFIEIALAKAPDSKKPQLQSIADTIEGRNRSSATAPPDTKSAPASGTSPDINQLQGDDRLQYQTLLSMLQDADKAADLNARHQILGDFLNKSGDLLKTHTEIVRLWAARAAVAAELDRLPEAWEAGQKLKTLGAEAGKDPGVEKVMVELNKKGWLDLTPEIIVSWFNAHLDIFNSTFTLSKVETNSARSGKHTLSTNDIAFHWSVASFALESGLLKVDSDVEMKSDLPHSSAITSLMNVSVPISRGNLHAAVREKDQNSRPLQTPAIEIKGAGIKMAITTSFLSSKKNLQNDVDLYIMYLKDLQSAQSASAMFNELITLSAGNK